MPNEHRPRLCHVTKWKHFDGYGFTLTADKTTNIQYIGTVKAGSPAQAAGLRDNDQIVQVNGEDVTDKAHKEVVKKITANTDETKLLVVDRQTDDLMRQKGDSN